MAIRKIFPALLALAAIMFASGKAFAAQRKDYLIPSEANKIRDAEPGDRIKLFIFFADDRLKKFQYEASRAAEDRLRAKRMHALLNDYIECLYDVEEIVDLGREKNWNIKKGAEEADIKTKEFLAALEALAKTDLERLSNSRFEAESLKDALREAIAETNDVRELLAKNSKEDSSPPVRRKQ